MCCVYAEAWDLQQAIELLVMCQTGFTYQHSMKEAVQENLSCLSFCRDVLSNEDARMEFKYEFNHEIPLNFQDLMPNQHRVWCTCRGLVLSEHAALVFLAGAD